VSPAYTLAQPQAQPSTQPIPRDEWLAIFKRELGDFYVAQDPTISSSPINHGAILHRDQSEQRKAILAAIEVNGVDPNILGRLATTLAPRGRSSPPRGSITSTSASAPWRCILLGVPKTTTREILAARRQTSHADAFVGDSKPNADDVQRIYTEWMSAEMKAHPDALLIMPLLNLDLWGPSYAA